MKSVKASRGAPALEWLCDLTGRTARITSIGNRSLLVENYRGILEFGRERIVLGTHCGCVEVTGASLCLAQVRRDSLVIEGDMSLERNESPKLIRWRLSGIRTPRSRRNCSR